jgi:hypothetical protein
LISIVQEETLDESWIPVTEKEWREQQDSENEYITKKVNKTNRINLPSLRPSGAYFPFLSFIFSPLGAR